MIYNIIFKKRQIKLKYLREKKLTHFLKRYKICKNKLKKLENKQKV